MKMKKKTIKTIGITAGVIAAVGAGVLSKRGTSSADSGGAGSRPSFPAGCQQVLDFHCAPARP